MKKIYLGLIVIFCCTSGFAQNTASPYSILGIGDIEKSYFDKTSAMGHAGIALTSDRSVLLSNPASLSFPKKVCKILLHPLHAAPPVCLVQHNKMPDMNVILIADAMI